MVDFAVPRWLQNPHVQTLGAAAPLFSPPRSYETCSSDPVRIPLPTGGSHFLHGKAWWARGVAPIVVIVHGIGGSSESKYGIRAAVGFHRAGYHVLRLDLRSAGGSIADAPTLYHAGLGEDYDLVVEFLAMDARVQGVVIVGFSGGGSMALKRAGEWGACPPKALLGVAAISAPLDYVKVGPWMDSFGRVPYRFHVLRGLTEGAKAFARIHPERAHYRAKDVKRMGTFRAYDAQVIVPMHGFRDVDAYYAEASAGPHLGRIEVPALLLHAKDDPMVPAFTVEPWLAEASKSVRVELSEHGGHIGWVTGFDEASWVSGWANAKVLEFLRRVAPLGCLSPGDDRILETP